jgi:hypothetical protein
MAVTQYRDSAPMTIEVSRRGTPLALLKNCSAYITDENN